MKHFILIALLFAASPALATDRVFMNPESNGDLRIKANVAGTPTDAVVVTGATGGVTIGAANTVTNVVLGGVKFDTTQGGTGGYLRVQNSPSSSVGGILVTQIGANTASTTGFRFYSTGTGSAPTSGGAAINLAAVDNSTPDTVAQSIANFNGNGDVAFFGAVKAAKQILSTTATDATLGTINALATPSSVINLNGSGSIILNGITAPATEGALIFIHNNTGAGMTVNTESGSATATNRLSFVNGAASKTILNTNSLMCFYSGSRWRCLISGGQCTRSTGTASATGGTSATASCTSPAKAVGGGCSVSTSTGAVGLIENYANTDSTWQCTRLASGAGTMTATVWCCDQ